MDENQNLNNEENNQFNDETNHNISLYFLFIISSILVFVDSIDMYHVIKNWEVASNNVLTAPPVIESCIKWELYSKTTFSLLSLFGAFSALFLSTFLIIDTNYFAEKLLNTYLYFNYIMFGPYMLGICILGFFNWSKVVYQCDKQNMNNKILSLTNMVTLISCFMMSLFITALMAILKTVNLYINSTLRRPEGNVIIRKLFWWVVFRNKEPVEFIRQAQQLGNNNGNNV
jgi:hypothetical protein